MDAKHADRTELTALSGQIIGRAIAVLNTLGAGYLEKVYENAFACELREQDLVIEQQHGITVRTRGWRSNAW